MAAGIGVVARVFFFFFFFFFFVLVPGFLETVANLFTTAAGDSSVLGRSDSYELALEFVARAPLLGRGFLKFLPQYRILDYQYLRTLIDTGIVGMLALVGLFVVALVASATVWRRADTARERSLGVCFTAATTTAAASFALFDAFSFPQMAGTTFLILGMSGAVLRVRGPRHETNVPTRSQVHGSTGVRGLEDVPQAAKATT